MALVLGAALSGCGGGAGETAVQTDTGYQVVSGVAQKGPLTMGSSVSINELNATTLVPLGTGYDFEIRDDFGNFQPAGTVFKQRLLETTASGYYLDELTGQVSTDTVTLRGMSDLSVDRTINVNLLTDLSNARIRTLMTRAAAPLGLPLRGPRRNARCWRRFPSTTAPNCWPAAPSPRVSASWT